MKGVEEGNAGNMLPPCGTQCPEGESDEDERIDLFGSVEGLESSGFVFRRLALGAQQILVEHLVDERAFARSRDARHADEQSERDRHVDAPYPTAAKVAKADVVDAPVEAQVEAPATDAAETTEA